MPSRTNAVSTTFLALSVLAHGSIATEAASPNAWQAFRKDVETSCLKAASTLIKEPGIVVDPFGSDSYGLAVVKGVAIEDGLDHALVCIYDKIAKRAEIGGSMAIETAVSALGQDVTTTRSIPISTGGPLVLGVPTNAAAAISERFLSPSASTAPAKVAALAPPAAPDDIVPPTGAAAGAAFAGQCDAKCAVTLADLGEPDRDELQGLAEEVEQTLDRKSKGSLAKGPGRARDLARAVAASAQGTKAGAVSAPTPDFVGETSCVLYYYGYSGEASRTVGRHRCSVTKGDGDVLVVEKTSGERLRAEIKPLTSEVSAFVGRTFEAGQKETKYDPAKPLNAGNDDLGNTVGFAAEDDGQLVLVSSQRRKFKKAGDFFWVLALDPK